MITFFSDPHIGLNRQAGTTPATRDVIRQRILDAIPISNATGVSHVCLGDLFDKFTNNESVIKDAYAKFKQIDLCLAGNHDIKATAESVGSLQLLGSLHHGNLVINKFGEAGIDSRNIDGVKIVSVPHCSTQDLFFDSLMQAETEGGEILLLHCNYDAPEHHDLSDTELNLRKEDAVELLKVFKYILLGHEHNAADHFDGRLKIIGAPYPTSFNDMKSKRYLQYENGEFTSIGAWNSCNYVEVVWPDIHYEIDTEFVRITGKRTQSESKEFLVFLNKLRKTALAIKDDTVVEGMQTEFTEVGTPLKLSENIRKALADKPEELALWNKLSGECDDRA